MMNDFQQQLGTMTRRLSTAMDTREELTQDITMIMNLTNDDVIQMNIQWIEKHIEKAPIAVAVVLGDVLELLKDTAHNLEDTLSSATAPVNHAE
jgi:hypothetical protein